MHQTKKGNEWKFGMKCHIGVDAGSGLVHTITVTAANEHDITQAAELDSGKMTRWYMGILGIWESRNAPKSASNEHFSNIDFRINRRPGQSTQGQRQRN